MTQLLDHAVRQANAWTLAQYCVADLLARCYPDSLGAQRAGKLLGCPPQVASKALRDLSVASFATEAGGQYEATLGLLGVFRPTLAEDDVEVPRSRVDDIAEAWVERINYLTGKQTRVCKGLKDRIAKVLKAYPEYDVDHFLAALEHRYAVWGEDEKMSQYITDTTIIRSVDKFEGYLEKARVALRSQN